tara:strand:+ start:339 stop:530 length:192 start_codon:yes stop_codon:yes gene_type:complete
MEDGSTIEEERSPSPRSIATRFDASTTRSARVYLEKSGKEEEEEKVLAVKRRKKERVSEQTNH